MEIYMRKLIVLVAFALLACSSQLHAQPAVATKVGTFDSEALSDSKTGVKRLVAVYDQLSREFKPKMDELEGIRARYDALAKSIEAMRNTASAETLRAKSDELETLARDIQRKQEDGQKALDSRRKQLTDPVFQDLAKAIDAYARQRGYDIVFDVSKLAGAILPLNRAMDITAAFINDYNAKNPTVPAGVPAKTP
jgi:outer membrane protein